MNVTDIRFLYAYDRWATKKVLAAAVGLSEDEWPAGRAIDERHLGEILVHALGAHQRWRHGLSGSEKKPRPERDPLPTLAALTAAWDAEWVALDAWLASIDDEWLATTDEGVPMWQMLAHVVNHGTQHRSEAAALLTDAGRSPGDLDLIYFAEAEAGVSG